MKRIGILMYPSLSHFVASYPLYQELERRGFKPTYFVPYGNQMDLDLERNGLRHVRYHPITTVSLSGLAQFLSHTIYNIFSNKFKLFRYRCFLRQITSFELCLKRDNIKHVLIDDLMPHYGFICLKNHVAFDYLNTKHSGYYRANCAPLESRRFFIRSKSFALNFLDGLYHLTRRLARKVAVDISQNGFGFYKMFEEHSKRGGDFFRYSMFHHSYSFNSIIKNRNIYIIGSPSLEYPWVKLFKGETYLALKDKYDSKRFISNSGTSDLLLKELSEKHNHVRIILVSFGRLPETRQYDLESLYRKTLKCLANVENTCVIVSMPKDILSKLSKEFDTAVFKLYHFVPQTKILQYCKLMINHGGLNSIIECVESSTPMICCPFVVGADHFTNSEKVVYHNIGRTINIVESSIDDIVSTINIALNDSHLQNNISKMKNKLWSQSDVDITIVPK